MGWMWGPRCEGCESEERQGRNRIFLWGCRAEGRDRASLLPAGADFWNLPQCPGPSLPKVSPHPHSTPTLEQPPPSPSPRSPSPNSSLPLRPSGCRLGLRSNCQTLSGCGAGVQNHVFIRNVLGIKTIMRYTLSSITITKHPGTELRVISRRGRRAGHTADGQGQAGRLRATGTHIEATRRTQHFATHSRFVFVWLFCVLIFFFFFFSLLRHVRVGELGNSGRERKAEAGHK